MVDGFGVYGYLFHYGLVFAFVGSAFLIFCYLWKNNRLDMDEEAKYQVFQSEQSRQGKRRHDS
jgi:hypothetical protein